METSTFWQHLPVAAGWMIAHSLWQITVLYLLYRLLAFWWAGRSQLLYLAALASMAGAAVWAAYTFVVTWSQMAQAVPLAPVPAALLPALQPVLSDGSLAWPQEVTPWYARIPLAYEAWAGLVGWLWCLAVLVLGLRLLGGYQLSKRLRKHGVRPVPADWQARCTDWATRLGIRKPVRWLESSRVAEPLTLGFWKPVVLFPAGLLLQLPPERVELLLLHELAHIRRADYLVNLIQMTLELCFFYHPLFWWLTREARRHREFACDDIVLQHQPNRIFYAQTLTELQLSFVHHQNAFAMNISGKSTFAQRILRIVGRPQPVGGPARWFPLLFLLLTLGTGWYWNAVSAQTPQVSVPLALSMPSKTAAIAPLSPVEAPANAEIPEAEPAPTPDPAPEPDTLSPSMVAVELNKMNIFYIGVDNPITVVVPGYDCRAVSVRLAGTGKLVEQGNCKYAVQVSQPGKVDIQIFVQDQGQEKQLGVKTFRVKRIPYPQPAFDGHYGNIIHKARLTEVFSQELKARMTNFDFDASCQITQFSVACQFTKDSGIVSFPVQGQTLSKEQLQRLEQVQPGGSVYVLDVKTQCPGDAAARLLGDLVFKVIE
ncbi:MAG: hypothetical protein IT260_20765 [Saprospiraceae bacterium]|nr:hypothetical protein [Saprospiraceae bacterium]